MHKSNILIYQDEGTDEICVTETFNSFHSAIDYALYQIHRVDSNYLNSHAWENETKLLVIPGGRSLPYYQKLKHGGNEKIIAFVKAGGKYLGICAGAYYGSAVTEFEKGNELEVICRGPLNFFSGVAAGPAFGLGKFRYESRVGAEIANISWVAHKSHQKNHQVYFNGGAYFVDAEHYNNVQVLATYQNIEHHSAAIIQCQVGAGIAILSGVHMEYSYRAISVEDPKNRLFHNTLKIAEKNRQILFKQMLVQLGFFNAIYFYDITQL